MGIAKPFKMIRKENGEIGWGAGIIAHLGTDILGLVACVGRSTYIITVKESLGISIQPQNLLLALRQWILFLEFFGCLFLWGLRLPPVSYERWHG